MVKITAAIIGTAKTVWGELSVIILLAIIAIYADPCFIYGTMVSKIS